MAKVSAMIPARNEPFATRTVVDLLEKATGDVEVIIALDDFWPDPPLPDDKRLKVLHRGSVHGLRPNINAMVEMATGEYLMKIDAHCTVCPGYDELLQKDCDKDWVVVPAKHSLEPTTWTMFKPAWQYFYLTFPYHRELEFIGLHDKNFGPSWNHARADKPIDDIISFQGSCWFLPKAYFKQLLPEGMDHEHYYYAQEPQELGLKAWLSGGRVVVNKAVTYGHLHKGRAHGRGFPRYKRPWIDAIRWSANYWMTNQWPGRVHDMDWLVTKFWDELHHAPAWAWPDDWQDPTHKAFCDTRGC